MEILNRKNVGRKNRRKKQDASCKNDRKREAGGIGVNGISIDGASGVSTGSYDGYQKTWGVGVQGTNGNTSYARTNVRGVSTGTNANGSVIVTGAYFGDGGNVSGSGNFNA